MRNRTLCVQGRLFCARAMRHGKMRGKLLSETRATMPQPGCNGSLGPGFRFVRAACRGDTVSVGVMGMVRSDRCTLWALARLGRQLFVARCWGAAPGADAVSRVRAPARLDFACHPMRCSHCCHYQRMTIERPSENDDGTCGGGSGGGFRHIRAVGGTRCSQWPAYRTILCSRGGGHSHISSWKRPPLRRNGGPSAAPIDGCKSGAVAPSARAAQPRRRNVQRFLLSASRRGGGPYLVRWFSASLVTTCAY